MEAQALHSPIQPPAGQPAEPRSGDTGGGRAGQAETAEQRRTPARGLKGDGASNDKPADKVGDPTASRAQLSEAVAEANSALRQLDVRLELSVDRETEEVVARVVNDHTGEVVREIPREEVRGLARRLQETGGGALLDTRG